LQVGGQFGEQLVGGDAKRAKVSPCSRKTSSWHAAAIARRGPKSRRLAGDVEDGFVESIQLGPGR